jgi:phage-related minor tail protein
LAIILSAQDKASGIIGMISEKLGGLGKLAAIGAAGAGAGLAGVGAAAVKMGADLDAAMQQSKAQTGATSEEMKRQMEVAKDLYKTNTDSIQDITRAMTVLRQRWGDLGDDTKAQTQKFLDFAKVLGVDNAQAVETVSKAVKGMGGDIKDTDKVMDILLTAQQRYGADAMDLARIISENAGTFRALGLSTDETVGLLASMEKQGVNTSRAVMGLRQAAQKFETPEEFQKSLKNLASIQDTTKRTQAAFEIFGAFAGPGIANLLSSGTGALSDFTEGLEGSEGAVKEASDAVDESFNVRMELAKKKVLGMVMDLGSRLLPAILPIIEALADNLGPALDTIGRGFETVSAYIRPIVDLIKNFGDGTVALPGPLTDMAQVLNDEVVPAIQELWGNFQKFIDDIQPLIGPALENIETVIKAFLDTIREWIKAFLDTVREWWDRHGEDVLKIVEGLWEMIQGIVQVAAAIIGGIIKVFLALLAGDMDAAGEALKEMWEGVWEGIQKIFEGGVEAIGGLLWTLITTVGEIGAQMGKALWDALTEAIQSIKIDIGPFHLSARGFTVDMPQLPFGLGEGPPPAGVQGLTRAQGVAVAPSVVVQNVHLRDRGEMDYFTAQISNRVGREIDRRLRFGGLAP